MITLVGRDAITYARAHSLPLSSHTDPTSEGRTDLTVEEALEIALEDPSLVYLEIGREAIEALSLEATIARDLLVGDLCAILLTGTDPDNRKTTLRPCTLEEARRGIARVLVDSAARM